VWKEANREEEKSAREGLCGIPGQSKNEFEVYGAVIPLRIRQWINNLKSKSQKTHVSVFLLNVIKEDPDYAPWYRLAQEVFDTLIPQLSDQEIKALSAKRANWFAIPVASEASIEEVANRQEPHLDFKLMDDGKSIRIGIRCNTVSSVEKLENILNSFHTVEKDNLIAEMRKLDGDFKTQVMSKIKETNFARVDAYERKFEIVSNSINENYIHQIFATARTIRDSGTARKRDKDLRLNPETPVIDLCYTVIDAEPPIFKAKLLQLKRIYEICLSVKTSSELREEEEKKRRKSVESRHTDLVTKYVCSKCGKEVQADPTHRLRFCDQDGMRIVAVKISQGN
jgi:DNA-directed RNA polymerase subunit RPC12/RpoP